MSRPTVVLLAAPGESTNILYNYLAAHFHVLGVVMERTRSRAAMLRRRLTVLGLPTVAGQLAFQLGLVPYLRMRAQGRLSEIKLEFDLDDTKIPQAQMTPVESVNSPAAREHLRELNPDVVVISGTRILSPETLASVQSPFVNVHAGITPLYRGVHGGYWALVGGGPEGVTVHLVDEGIDTGAILAQRMIACTADDSFVTYPLLQLATALPDLGAAISNLERGIAEAQAPPAGPSRLWSHPTVCQYLRNRAVHGVV